MNLYSSMVEQARAIPGVRSVGLTDWMPLTDDHNDTSMEVEDHMVPSNSVGADHFVATVDGEYFNAMRIPMLRGRAFGRQDPARPSPDVIVSHAFAERYWKGSSPIGKRIRPFGGDWHTIVGEVGDAHYDGLDKPVNDIVYFPIVSADKGRPSTPSSLALVVRTDGREGEALSGIRRIVHSLDAGLPTYDERPVRELVRGASARAQALVVLLAIASALALTLGAIGLYGVMAYSVSMRRRELGVRIALGARPADVSRMVTRDGLRLAGAGVVIGLVCAIATSRVLRGLLYDVSATDPLTLTVTVIVLLVVAFAASWVPARRAAAVDPAWTLRS
jgi:predicted permease